MEVVFFAIVKHDHQCCRCWIFCFFKEGLLALGDIDEYLMASEQKAKKFDLGEMNLYVQNKLSSLPQ